MACGTYGSSKARPWSGTSAAHRTCTPGSISAPGRDSLPLGVIPVSCLHHQAFLFDGQADLAEPGIGPVRRIAQAVLVAQLLLNAIVDLLDGLLLGDFKKAPAGFLRNPLENFLSVRTLLRKPAATVRAAALPASAPAHT